MVAIALMEMAVSIVCKNTGGPGEGPARATHSEGRGKGTLGAAPPAPRPLPLTPKAELPPGPRKRPHSTPPHTLPSVYFVGCEGDPAWVPTPWWTAELSRGPCHSSDHPLRKQPHPWAGEQFPYNLRTRGNGPESQVPSVQAANPMRPTQTAFYPVHVRMHVRVHAFVCTHPCARVCTLMCIAHTSYAHACTFVCTCICVCMCARVCACAYLYACLCVQVCVFMCVCAHTRVCVYWLLQTLPDPSVEARHGRESGVRP